MIETKDNDKRSEAGQFGSAPTNLGRQQDYSAGPDTPRQQRKDLPAMSEEDSRIADEVREALLRDRQVDVNLVDIYVKNGVVVLSGAVPEEARGAADAAVSAIPGVRRVDNELSSNEPHPEDVSGIQSLI